MLADQKTSPIVEVSSLSFRYSQETPLVLRDINLQLLSGERHLLVGANGSGKTTLLRVIAGKHMIGRENVRLWGRPAFHDTSLSSKVTYTGGTFRCFVDITVAEMLERRSDANPKRLHILTDLLKIDPSWHMNRVSAGQRRRVQLFVELVYEKPLLLLDEVTSDLDIVVRADLLDFLKDEAKNRGVCIFYATHVLDGMEEWATHLTAMEKGRIKHSSQISHLKELAELKASGLNSPLYRLVDKWIRGDAEVESRATPPERKDI